MTINNYKHIWLFMRGSGIILFFLIFIHIFSNMIKGEGVQAINFSFVASKWGNPLWQFCDLCILWIAILHGANGMNAIIDDYTCKSLTNKIMKTILSITSLLLCILGTFVIVTLNPCPGNLNKELLPPFCGSL